MSFVRLPCYFGFGFGVGVREPHFIACAGSLFPVEYVLQTGDFGTRSSTIAFVAGTSADAVIDWVVNNVLRLIGMGGGEPLSLSLVQGVDPALEAFLHEEGIDSIQVLQTRGELSVLSNVNSIVVMIKTEHFKLCKREKPIF